jgi:hypothetical protein
MLFGFMNIFGRVTAHNLVYTYIITYNCSYYMIGKLTLQNEYFILGHYFPSKHK